MNAIKKAAIAQYNFEHRMMELSGYKTKTTFYLDFTIADVFEVGAVIDTFNTAFTEYKKNLVYLTELSMVLNHKIWEHYQDNRTLAEVYNMLWQKVDSYCLDNLKGEDLRYYLQITD